MKPSNLSCSIRPANENPVKLIYLSADFKACCFPIGISFCKVTDSDTSFLDSSFGSFFDSFFDSFLDSAFDSLLETSPKVEFSFSDVFSNVELVID